MADFTTQHFLKANEENAKMGFFKMLKCWKRAGNSRTAVTGGKFSIQCYEITNRCSQFYSTATDIIKPRWE